MNTSGSHSPSNHAIIQPQCSRRDVLTFGAATALATAVSPMARVLADTGADRPNVVLITVDDMDFDELSPYSNGVFPCYTHAHKAGLIEAGRKPHFQNLRFLDKGEPAFYEDPQMLTPAMERVANEGVRFDRFYVTSSICTPSRYSILTGRYASRSQRFQQTNPPGQRALVRWNTYLGPSEANLGQTLGRAGYHTGHVGKWHLSPIPEGYWARRDRIWSSDPHDPETQAAMRDEYARALQQVRDDSGFDEVSRLYYTNKESLIVPGPMRVHNTAWVAEGAVRFIDREHKKPFFLHMGLTTPHGQYYRGWMHGDPRATPAGMLEAPPDVVPGRYEVVERLKDHGIDPRNAMATSIDDAINAVLQSLDSRGIADNTLLVVISDHQSRGKNACYEGARVPCLLRWPRNIRGGQRTSQILANIDLVPTILAAAGINASSYPTDGENMLPLITGPGRANARDGLMLEVGASRAYVTEQWKYIANRPTDEAAQKMQEDAAQAQTRLDRRVDWQGFGNGHWGEEGTIFYRSRDFPGFFDRDQLYDLAADPFEQVNRIDDLPKIAAAAREKLSAASKSLPHPFPI